MSAFLFAVNRINMSYGEEVKLTKSEKLMHAYKVLSEWPSARKQLHMENVYNSEHGIHLGDKLWKNQQYNTLKVYDSLCSVSGVILENILEWVESVDKFSNETTEKLSFYPSSNLDTIEKELKRSAENHNGTNKHRYIVKLLESSNTTGIQELNSCGPEFAMHFETISSDIAGIQDSQSYRPGNTITAEATPSGITGKLDSQSYLPIRNSTSESQKYKAMTMDEFLDLYPLPSNLFEVDCQTTGRDFHFLRALNPMTVKAEAPDSLSSANSFWKLPDISNQLTRFLDNWEYDRKFNSRYSLGFVDCLLELTWIRDRMLAAKNMNAKAQLIFWDKIDLKSKSDVTWLFNWCKKKPTILLNVIRQTIKQLTENNESDSVLFSSEEFMELEFKFWLCFCEHEYLKLVNVVLFETLIDHNVIYDHNKFGCQELINSGMLLINLDILKSYINDRNSFTIEERKNLGLNKEFAPPSTEPDTALNIHDCILNASLDSDTNNPQEEKSITFPTMTSDLSSINTSVTQHEKTNTHPEVQPYDRKDKICRKVMDETTLRIYFPRHVDTVDTTSTRNNDAIIPNLMIRLNPDPTPSQTKATSSLGQLYLLSCILTFTHLYTMTS